MATPTYIQSVDTDNGTNTATASATLPANLTANSSVQVFVAFYDAAGTNGIPTATCTGVTGTQGKTYTVLNGGNPVNDTAHVKTYAFLAQGPFSAAAETVTAAISGFDPKWGCIIFAYEIGTSGPGVVWDSTAGLFSASGTTTGTPVTAGTLTTSAANELALMYWGEFATATAGGAGTGWTGGITASGDIWGWQSVAAASTINVNGNISAVSPRWFAIALAVKEAAASTPLDDEPSGNPTPPRSALPAGKILAAAAVMAASLAAGVQDEVVAFPQLVVEDSPAYIAPRVPPPTRAAPCLMPPPDESWFASAVEDEAGPPPPPWQWRAALWQDAAQVGPVAALDELPVAAVGAFGLEDDAPFAFGPPALSVPRYPAAPPDEQLGITPRITVDASGRYLLRDGKPWRLHSAATWLAVTNAQPSDLATLFSGLVAQGFNACILETTVYPGSHSGTPNSPGNYNGDLPFLTCVNTSGTGNTNLDEPNEPYWAWVELFISTANSYGITVVLNGLYFSHFDQGWNNAAETRPLGQAHNTANSNAACTFYGTYLAKRFGKYDVIWQQVGDDSSTNAATTYTVTQVAAAQAIYAAIKAALPGAIFTGEPAGSVTDERFRATCTEFNAQTNLDATYGQGDAINGRSYKAAQGAWAASPSRPSWTTEPEYENTAGALIQNVRKEIWWGALGGNLAGNNYGTNNLWNFQTAGSAWQTALTSTGMQQQAKFIAFMGSIRWWTLQPVVNGGTQLLTVNTGAFDTDTYAQSALASDGRLAVVYIPPNGSGAQSVTVDLSQLSVPVQASWFDPTSGARTAIGGFANSGTQAFTSPGNNAAGQNDWALLLDALAIEDNNAGIPPRADLWPAALLQDAAIAASLQIPPEEDWFPSAIEEDAILCPLRCGGPLALSAPVLANLALSAFEPPDELPVAVASTLGVEDDAPPAPPPGPRAPLPLPVAPSDESWFAAAVEEDAQLPWPAPPPPPPAALAYPIGAPADDWPTPPPSTGIDEDAPTYFRPPAPPIFPQPITPADDSWFASAVEEDAQAVPPPAPPLVSARPVPPPADEAPTPASPQVDEDAPAPLPPPFPPIRVLQTAALDEWIPVPVLFGLDESPVLPGPPPPRRWCPPVASYPEDAFSSGIVYSTARVRITVADGPLAITATAADGAPAITITNGDAE